MDNIAPSFEGVHSTEQSSPIGKIKRVNHLGRGERFAWLDAAKGIAACIIVGHHLSEYSPSSNLADQFAPSLMYGIYNYGLFVVHLFLVFGGFAMVMMTPNHSISWRQASSLFTARYVRLVVPYLVMLLFLVTVFWAGLCDGMIPPLIDSFSWWQLLAHVFFLQDILGLGNLSAGTWYLCIDIQYVGYFLLIQATLNTLGRIVGRDLASPSVMSILLFPLGMISIGYWSRILENEIFVFYFLGSLVLGTLVGWELKGQLAPWVVVLYVIGMAGSLAIELRPRVLVALGAALILVVAVRLGRKWSVPLPLQWLGKISYSLFLIHYLVNALVLHGLTPWIGRSPYRAFVSMLVAFSVSLLAAAALHYMVEAPCHRWLKSQKQN
ncbi:MAG: acyltransferase [Pirellula sp.]